MNNGILLYESLFLKSLASSLPEGAQAVNIGAGHGTSSAAILEGAKHLQDFYLWSIDIDREAREPETLAELGLMDEKRYAFVVSRSCEALIEESSRFSLVFVDGEHSRLGVSDDLERWGPRVLSGGFLVCHDYGDPRQRALTEAINDWHRFNKKNWYKLGTVCYTVAFLRADGDNEWSMGRIAQLRKK